MLKLKVIDARKRKGKQKKVPIYRSPSDRRQKGARRCV